MTPEADPAAQTEEDQDLLARWPFLRATSPIPTLAGLAVAGFGFGLLLLAWGKAASETAAEAQVPLFVSPGLVGFALIMVGLVAVTIQYKRHDADTLHRQIAELTSILGDLDRAETGDLSKSPRRKTEDER